MTSSRNSSMCCEMFPIIILSLKYLSKSTEHPSWSSFHHRGLLTILSLIMSLRYIWTHPIRIISCKIWFFWIKLRDTNASPGWKTQQHDWANMLIHYCRSRFPERQYISNSGRFINCLCHGDVSKIVSAVSNAQLCGWKQTLWLFDYDRYWDITLHQLLCM